MTWSEWGSVIYRNGKRRRDREERLDTCEFHGMAGDGTIRLIWDRDYPILCNGPERIDVDEIPGFERWDEEECLAPYEGVPEFSGAYQGASIRIRRRHGYSVVDFEFTESNGTRWTGTVGYLRGVWDDDFSRKDTEKFPYENDWDKPPSWPVP